MTGRPDPNRPARATVRAAVRAALADLEPGARVVVGLSGGADSLALLGATVMVGREQGLGVACVVVDHGIQADSAAVAARAAEQARLLGCDDVTVVPVDVARGPGSGGLEAAARRARYDALLRCAGPFEEQPAGDHRGEGAGPAGRGGAEAVLLGHTRDDQAETVLLGLARGSGTRSLAGMAPRSGIYRRPLLGLPRSLVARAVAEEAGGDPRLTPWVDPHNEDASFARVRVRRAALPALEGALGPGVVDALARTARLAREDADALDAWADRVWSRVTPVAPDPLGSHDPGRAARLEAHPESGIVEQREPGTYGSLCAALDLALLHPAGADPWDEQLPEAVVSRVVRRLLIAAGCPPGSLTAEHVWAVTALTGPDGRGEVALPGGRRSRREGGTLVVRA